MRLPLILTTRTLGHGLLAASLAALSVLRAVPAQAQIAPTPAPPMQSAPHNVTYYIDGKPATQAETSQLLPANIQSIDVLKGATARKELPGAAADGVVLITTKANANSPAVLAFNKRFPKTPATPEQNTAVAAITTYLTRTYPTAKLEMVAPVEGKPDRYRAIFKQNDQRLQLLFDGQGQPVKE